jgi:hypothetical protein
MMQKSHKISDGISSVQQVNDVFVNMNDGDSHSSITRAVPLSLESNVVRMSSRRYQHAQLNYHDEIVVIGGEDGHEALKTVEAFNVVNKTWRRLKDMNYARDGPGACVFGKYIIVFGGQIHNLPMNTCEIYDPDTDSWTNLPNMILKRYKPAVCVFNKTNYKGGLQSDYSESNLDHDAVSPQQSELSKLLHLEVYITGGNTGLNVLRSIDKLFLVKSSLQNLSCMSDVSHHTVDIYSISDTDKSLKSGNNKQLSKFSLVESIARKELEFAFVPMNSMICKRFHHTALPVNIDASS